MFNTEIKDNGKTLCMHCIESLKIELKQEE
jgi:hypothetical protein